MLDDIVDAISGLFRRGDDVPRKNPDGSDGPDGQRDPSEPDPDDGRHDSEQSEQPGNTSPQINPDNLEVVDTSRSGRVWREKGGHATPKEVQHADEIATREGRDIVLSSQKDQPGIDGFYRDTGQPIQLKEITSGKPAKIVTRANEAYDNAINAGFDNLDVQIKAPNLTVAEIERRWNASGTTPSPRYVSASNTTVQRIVVVASDGVVELHFPEP
jgi:hypothetical protein